MARTLLAGERTTIAAARVAHYDKVEVQNASGTWKDVGALLGGDYVIGASWGEHRDQAVASLTVRIRRRIGANSLSPLVVASLLNRDDLGNYAPLLDPGRGIRVYGATLSPFGTPTTEYREGITGRIDDVLWDQDPITVQCSDLGAWLMDTQIEVERPYGSVTGIAVETVIAQILADWPVGRTGLVTPTLTTPTSPAWNITTYKQSRVKLLEGLRALALQIGWDLRYRHDSAHVSRLTLYDPDRDNTTVHATIGPTEYTDLRRLGISIADIRNVGRSTYRDAAGVTHEVMASDAASILKYGRRYFELPAADGIDTLTEAQARIDAAVWDLAGPGTELELVLPYFWPVQLYDRHTITQNGEHYDTDQTMAVVGYQHTLEDGHGVTTISYAGRVTGAYADWRRGIRVVAPKTPTDETGLARFEYRQNADGSTTFSWVRGVQVHAVWVFQTQGAITDPLSSLYPAADALPYPVLLAGTDTFTVARPAIGSRTLLRFTPVTAALIPGVSTQHIIGTNGAYSVGVVVVENPNGTATVTATALDPAGLIAAGSRLSLWVTIDGVRSLLSPTTAPSAGVTTGTYTWVLTQDEKHSILAELYTNLSDGQTPLEWTGTIDADKIANVVNATANLVGTTATVRVLFDTDTRTGVNGYGWRVNGGAETLGTVAGDRTASFTVAASTTTAKLVEVRGYNAEGVAGPWAPVPIDAMGPLLTVRARELSKTATTYTVRVAVADPFPQGASTGTITHDGGGAVTPATGGTVTPAATITEAAGTFIDYTITRPAFGSGPLRVTFTGSAANRQSNLDAVDVQAQERDTVALAVSARIITSTTTQLVIRVAVADPYPQGTNSATITYQSIGTGGVSPASGGTVTPVATLTEGAGTFIDYTVTRPARNTGCGQVIFTATAANRAPSAPAPVTVPAQQDATTSKPVMFSALGLTPETSTTSFIKNSANGFSYASNGTAAVSATLVKELYLADGLTITKFDTLTWRTNAGDTVTVDLCRVNRSTRTQGLLATHSNSTTGVVQTISTTGLSETIDNTTYVYFVRAYLVGAAITDARIYDYGIAYTQTSLTQSF